MSARLLYERLEAAIRDGSRVVILPDEVRQVSALLTDFISVQRKIATDAASAAERARSTAGQQAAILWRWRQGWTRERICKELGCEKKLVARVTAGVRRPKHALLNWRARYLANRKAKP